MSNFHFKLKELRTNRKVQQKELALLLDVTTRAIRNYENGSHEPSYDRLIKLADYFDVSLDYLVGRSDEPDNHKMIKVGE